MPHEYDNNMRGALFANDDRREGKKDPTHRGQCEIDGVEYWIDAWVNESKKGRRYFALRFKAKESRRERAEPESAHVPVVKPMDFDDPIPF